MKLKIILLLQPCLFLFVTALFRSAWRRQAIFNPHEGFVLSNHVIGSRSLITSLQCASLCVSTPNCSSYNYGKGQLNFHVCDLNNATRSSNPENLKKKDSFSYYESVGKIGPDCASNPCPIEEICLDTCDNDIGYLCKKPVLDAGTTGKSNDFSASFYSDLEGSYLQYQGIVPQMTKLTVCFWLVYGKKNIPTFRYNRNNSSSGEIDAYINQGELTFRISPHTERSASYTTNWGNDWHHVCWQWKNTNGRWTYYLNGKTVISGDNYAVGTVIPGLGTFYFGKAGFDYSGVVLSHLDVWSYMLPAVEIGRLWKGCTGVEGDAAQWRGFRSGINGRIKIKERAACTLPTQEVATKRNQYCQTLAVLPVGSIALFEVKNSLGGKRWRCYSPVAVIVDTKFGGYKYNLALGSTALVSDHSKLTAIVN